MNAIEFVRETVAGQMQAWNAACSLQIEFDLPSIDEVLCATLHLAFDFEDASEIPEVDLKAVIERLQESAKEPTAK